MGFQWLLLAASANTDFALDPSDGTKLDSYNISLALDFTSSAKSSRLFSGADGTADAMKAMEILGN
jgi:fructose-1,6-bisphosphatase/sedoheptulose 1,7-bisphosphatase-like protein